MIADVPADNAVQRPEDGAQHHHRRESIHEQARGGRGCDEHGQHQDDADRAEADNDRRRQQQEQQQLEREYRVTQRLGVGPIEAHEQQLLAQCDQHADDARAGQRADDDVIPAGRQQVPDQKGRQVALISRLRADEHDPQRKGAGEEDADGRVLANSLAAADDRNRDRGECAGHHGAGEDRQPGHVGEDDAGKDGVAERVADEGQPSQDDVGTNRARGRAHHDGGNECLAKDIER